MKLILCKSCGDVVRLWLGATRWCFCGKSHGKYVDEYHAKISGDCVPLGIANQSLAEAVKSQDEIEAVTFRAFVIEKNCQTISVGVE